MFFRCWPTFTCWAPSWGLLLNGPWWQGVAQTRSWHFSCLLVCSWAFCWSVRVFVQEIVALSGAHTLGRSRPDRSGWGKSETKYTVCFSRSLWLSLKQDSCSKRFWTWSVPYNANYSTISDFRIEHNFFSFLYTRGKSRYPILEVEKESLLCIVCNTDLGHIVP